MTATVPQPAGLDADQPTPSWARPFLGPFEKVSGGVYTFALAVLCALFFVDEVDTVTFGVLAPEIQKAFDLSDAQFVSLVILNLSIVLLAAIPIGYYGDKLPRTKLVVAGAMMAGSFSAMTGIATTIGLLAVARLGNGLGLLMNDPIHRSLISDYYPPDKRIGVFSFHSNAQRVAAVIGPVFAGGLAYLVDWRLPFVVMMFPIIFLGFVALKLPNPPRGGSEDPEAAAAAAEERAIPLGRASRILWTVRTLRRQYFAWLFIGAGVIPLAAYLPLYFERAFDMNALERGAFSSVNAAAAFMGVRMSSKWAMKWMAKDLGGGISNAGLSLMAVGPVLVLLAIAPTIWIALPIALFGSFAGAVFTPPFLATQSLVSPARVRSLSFGFGSLFIVAGLWVLFILTGVVGIPDARDKDFLDERDRAEEVARTTNQPFVEPERPDDGIRVGVGSLAPYWIIGGLILRSARKYVTDDVTKAMEVLSTTADLRRRRLSNDSSDILVVSDVDVSYGQVQILFGVNMTLAEGEILALLGTNGAGKSTLLKAISGLVTPTRGSIFFDGEDVTGLEPEDSFQYGLVQVPGGRGIFPGLTVKENLDVAAWASRRDSAETKAAIDEALATFPSLERRWEQPAAVLSGGEAQMLTLSMAFIAKPKLLMIDELSLGLAPIVVEELLKIVRRIHESGTSLILVEQSVNVALTVADRAIFMEKGEVRFSGPTKDLLARDDILRAVFLTGSTALPDGMVGE